MLGMVSAFVLGAMILRNQSTSGPMAARSAARSASRRGIRGIGSDGLGPSLAWPPPRPMSWGNRRGIGGDGLGQLDPSLYSLDPGTALDPGIPVSDYSLGISDS